MDPECESPPLPGLRTVSWALLFGDANATAPPPVCNVSAGAFRLLAYDAGPAARPLDAAQLQQLRQAAVLRLAWGCPGRPAAPDDCANALEWAMPPTPPPDLWRPEVTVACVAGQCAPGGGARYLWPFGAALGNLLSTGPAQGNASDCAALGGPAQANASDCAALGNASERAALGNASDCAALNASGCAALGGLALWAAADPVPAPAGYAVRGACAPTNASVCVRLQWQQCNGLWGPVTAAACQAYARRAPCAQGPRFQLPLPHAGVTRYRVWRVWPEQDGVGCVVEEGAVAASRYNATSGAGGDDALLAADEPPGPYAWWQNVTAPALLFLHVATERDFHAACPAPEYVAGAEMLAAVFPDLTGVAAPWWHGAPADVPAAVPNPAAATRVSLYAHVSNWAGLTAGATWSVLLDDTPPEVVGEPTVCPLPSSPFSSGAVPSQPCPQGCVGRWGSTSPPLQRAQPMPNHCPSDGKCQFQWHL